MSNYWIPQYKWQFVEWFSKKYPNYPKWKWQRMKLNNLRGKYHEEWRNA